MIMIDESGASLDHPAFFIDNRPRANALASRDSRGYFLACRKAGLDENTCEDGDLYEEGHEAVRKYETPVPVTTEPSSRGRPSFLRTGNGRGLDDDLRTPDVPRSVDPSDEYEEARKGRLKLNRGEVRYDIGESLDFSKVKGVVLRPSIDIGITAMRFRVHELRKAGLKVHNLDQFTGKEYVGAYYALIKTLKADFKIKG